MDNNVTIENEVLFEETPEVSNEIATLEGMNNILVNGTQDLQDVKNSAVTKVEQRLAEFVGDVFKATKKDMEFSEKLKAELESRLSNLSDNQIIALSSNWNVNLNDKISKVIAPTFGLLSTTHTAQISAESKKAELQAQKDIASGGVGSSTMNENIEPQGMSAEDSAAVIQGLNTIYQVVEAIKK